MLKKIISAQNGYRLMVVSLLACALPVHAQSSGPTLSCIVAEKGVDGEWVASRQVNGATGEFVPSQDTYEWRPNERTALGKGMIFSWSLQYYWPKEVPDRKTVPESAITVVLRVRGDAKLAGGPFNVPRRATMHLYRSADPEQRLSPATTSLTNSVQWDKFSNGDASTMSFLPLDTLLAFGTGMDSLVWNIRSEPNEYGGTAVLAKGTVTIATMRDKVSMLPKVRRLLDRKVEKFRTECAAPIPVDIL